MKRLIIVFGIFLLSSCAFRCKKRSSLKLDLNSEKHITIFIHGTLQGFYSPYVHSFKLPCGLCVATKLPGKFSLSSRFPRILNKFHCPRYPLDTFYLYTWSGRLTFEERKEAAHELYNLLKGYKGKITLITHSHGGNVALNLAHFAKQNPQDELQIEKLILLACPIQTATEHYCQSNIFKNVYSLYSTADLFQILDPQGMYAASEKLKKKGKYVPFFSQRRFTHSPNLIQARILLNQTNPKHVNFLLSSFLKLLPDIIDLLDTKQFGKNYAINIPKKGAPHIVLPKVVTRRRSRMMRSKSSEPLNFLSKKH